MMDFDPNKYREQLAQIHAKQVAAFVEQFPKRILHPEVERQLQYMLDSKHSQTYDMGRIKRQLERVTDRDRDWDNLSSVQVSRLWHSEGLLMARDAGAKRASITGPLDNKTCVVCKHMIGLQFDVLPAVQKMLDGRDIEDPDEYTAYWPFPRVKDVDNMSSAELAAKGYLPPFCEDCRHTVTWLTPLPRQ